MLAWEDPTQGLLHAAAFLLQQNSVQKSITEYVATICHPTYDTD